MTLALVFALAALAGLAIGVTIVIGALRMMRLRSYGLAMTASILALLPISPVGTLGFAMGVWSLYVLSRPSVRAAFAVKPARQPANASVEQQQAMRP